MRDAVFGDDGVDVGARGGDDTAVERGLDRRGAARGRPQRDDGSLAGQSGGPAEIHLTADGTVQAVEAVNASTEFMGGRRIIQRRKKLTAARISDLSVTMQELAS